MELKNNTLHNLYPLIIAGGYGTRLWPLSREKFPKQFQKLMSEDSLLQATIKRFNHETFSKNEPVLLCNKEHRFLIADQLQHINVRASIILEPIARNTAPAIAVGALHLLQQNPEAVMLVMPADHWISDNTGFLKAVELATDYAAQGEIVTFGVSPSTPETGFGYIELAEVLEVTSGLTVHSLQQFIEKPSADLAQAYVDSGNYLWNAGIFCLRAEVYLKALEQYQPEILRLAEKAYQNRSQDEDFLRIDEADFVGMPNISIDYAIMEKLGTNPAKVKVIPIDIGWNDIGSWSAIWDSVEKDENNNVVRGDVETIDTTGCYIRAESRLVSVIGISNCVIVETNDAVLIADKDQVQHVKTAVDKLKSQTRLEHSDHKLVRRPWGSYESIDSAERFQVKRITVKPGASLSLQMHYHRAEHWIVVKGTAEITCGEKNFVLQENQSTFIPFATQHRLKNPGIIPLELIEVQSGSYLGEDDIVRYEDQYGRAPVAASE